MQQPREWRRESKQVEKIRLWEAVGFGCGPWNNDHVISRAKKWKSEGGSVVIVSGSSQGLAEWASQSMQDAIDAVFGSTDDVNLTKSSKARFVEETFYGRHRTYVGDSVDDLVVWKVCHSALVIRSRRLELREVVTIDGNVETLPNVGLTWRLGTWIKLLLSPRLIEGRG